MEGTLGADLALAIQCIVVAIGGLIGNGALLAVITLNKELRRKDYICFIFNRTLVDFIYCILLGTIHVIGILGPTPKSPVCVAAGVLEVALSSTSIYTEPLLACNRYISIFHSSLYKRVYNMRNVFLMCAVVWVLGVFCALPHIFIGSLGRIPGAFCSIRFAYDTLAVTIGANYVLILISLGAILFCNYRMYRFLKSHQNAQMTNVQRTKLQSDTEMLKFIFVAAFLPLTFQTPVLAILCIQMMVPISEWVTFGGMALFTASFLVNPTITLSMVRPIRKEFLKTFKNLRVSGNGVGSVQNDQISQVKISRVIRIEVQQSTQ